MTGWGTEKLGEATSKVIVARALFGVAGVAGVAVVAQQNFESQSCLFPWANFIGLYMDGIHVT